jgi:hypothetical protein
MRNRLKLAQDRFLCFKCHDKGIDEKPVSRHDGRSLPADPHSLLTAPGISRSSHPVWRGRIST